MTPEDERVLGQAIRDGLFAATRYCHGVAVGCGWWTDLKTGEPKERNYGELLALVHSEVSEALEGHRKNLMDDHLPTRKMEEVELADVLIRIFDLAGKYNYDLAGALLEKVEYNRNRQDHKLEVRKAEGGKAF